MRKTLQTLARRAARAFALYVVADDYGTRQFTHTAAAALEWLPYCGKHALVCNRLTGRVLAIRSC